MGWLEMTTLRSGMSFHGHHLLDCSRVPGPGVDPAKHHFMRLQDPHLLPTPMYGVGDASYRAAGGHDGIRKLVQCFYEHMDTLDEARALRAMHAVDLTDVREKLVVFLIAWLGGPNEYRARFGSISIPGFHARFPIHEAERDAWLLCMARAVDEQAWAESFKKYFMQAISVPAERVRIASTMRRNNS
jgi:hemoglobin